MNLNLVLSGCGSNAIAYIALLKIINENNINIKNFAGASSGSIAIFLISLNYSYIDIYNIFIYNDSRKFFDIDINFNYKNINLLNFNKIEKILRLLLYNKENTKYITFKEFYEKRNKNLNIVAYNISHNKEIIFNYKNTPNKDIIESIISSCSIPFLFKINNISNNYYIDPFFKNNFPWNIFKNDLENTIAILLEENINNRSNFINLLINSIVQYKDYKKYKKNFKKLIRIKSLYSSLSILSLKERKIYFNCYYKILKKKIIR